MRIGTTRSDALTRLSTAILLAVGDTDRHGYAILKEIERQTEGELSPKAGSLYAALRRLAEEGLIVESPAEPAEREDPRRVYYRITVAGREAVQQEAHRMARTLRVAREKALLPALLNVPLEDEA